MRKTYAVILLFYWVRLQWEFYIQFDTTILRIIYRKQAKGNQVIWTLKAENYYLKNRDFFFFY